MQTKSSSTILEIEMSKLKPQLEQKENPQHKPNGNPIEEHIEMVPDSFSNKPMESWVNGL